VRRRWGQPWQVKLTVWDRPEGIPALVADSGGVCQDP
jgi:hypothetical protein